MTKKVLPVASTVLRNNLSEILDVVAQRQIMLVKRRDKAEVALIDADLLEDLLELHDKNYVKSIRAARREIKEGKTATFEQVFGDL